MVQGTFTKPHVSTGGAARLAGFRAAYAARHRQECLCHIDRRYLLKCGVFAGSNVAQTLLSVPGGEAAHSTAEAKGSVLTWCSTDDSNVQLKVAANAAIKGRAKGHPLMDTILPTPVTGHREDSRFPHRHHSGSLCNGTNS